ncbi:ShlB/FhaC/HecB family hemolysin secretion/activation protein [Polynucleobacter sp. 80A-SIGWE]|uniref:ShlB/FhaC/HecB family hemolysin secretion/activation protein n=1 Tax=Polynucleobacter sp. 80A-SIGWE TaxID=2689100 RepID=UPI001C0E08D2|nr:ShlB/FhaC/HecB family hemolysin secretion/activation protein [Polynucleobacter sp. 80A-SIGWE]MBU3589378.1 ShlB/FhaC/HecB family hemolysin secretion/activation protein [Polynucleobacter sp. 80A-SIGWE]
MKYSARSNQFHQSLFALAAIGMFSAGQVYAQVDAGALQQGLEKQLPSPSPLALPEPGPREQSRPSESSQSEVRFEVKSFVLEGVSILPVDSVQAILKSWIGRPVNFDDLQKACDAVVELYRKSGYTVQAILPPQKIANGVVKVLVTEAKLSSVFVDMPSGPTRFSKETAAEYITYANPIGEPLNTKAIERALIILNETPGVMVSSQLEPGQKDGETALRLQLTQPQWYQGKVEANNYGSRSTGANQGVIALSAINPTGIGDSASVNGIYSEGSQYIQGAYSLPGSKDGLRLGLSGTFLNYKNVSNYASSAGGGYGDAWTGGVSAAYPLIREQGTNVNVTANYDVKSYSNKNMLNLSTISAYTINNASLGLSGNHYDSFGGGGVSAGSATLVLGSLNISSTSVDGYGQYTPQSFTKFTFAGNRTQQLSEDGTTTAFISISGQLASVNLNSAEQIYMGGPYAIRAYPVAQGGGSQGGIGTIELRQQFPERIMASIFFDAGVVQQYKNLYANWQGQTNANNTYSLMGAGMGVKWDWEGWNLGAMVAWKVGSNPLYSQSGQAVNTDGTTTNPRGWLTASYQF